MTSIVHAIAKEGRQPKRLGEEVVLAQLFDKSLLDLHNSQVILRLTLYLLNIQRTVLLDPIRPTDGWTDGRTEWRWMNGWKDGTLLYPKKCLYPGKKLNFKSLFHNQANPV